jgi:hypothetical protein
MKVNMPRVGEYFYVPRRGKFVIYHQDTENIASPTGEVFFNVNAAKRRVYNLNGWKWKG